jgi:hypothetical protein
MVTLDFFFFFHFHFLFSFSLSTLRSDGIDLEETRTKMTMLSIYVDSCTPTDGVSDWVLIFLPPRRRKATWEDATRARHKDDEK